MIPYTPIIHNLEKKPYQLDLLRLDLLDKDISGNKWFKLKYNLEQARENNFRTIVTFGGAFSNHIAATAAACKRYQLNCVGIIRGERTDTLSDTLLQAQRNGMQLHFVDRTFYAQKEKEAFKDYLAQHFGKYYLIPEGGNNLEGVLGCKEILLPEWNYDTIICACGTATTYAGLLSGKNTDQRIIGISVLKGENTLPQETEKMLATFFEDRHYKIAGNEALDKTFLEEDCILNTYAFKGYAKFDPVVFDFKTDFEKQHNIPIDHVYTTKLLYATYDLIQKKKFRPASRILAIHSGGLQGNAGFEARYHLIPKR